MTALQAFRDLFAAEALRPGEQIAVGSLTVLFTDLRDSTRLYREIGDAPAFGSVVGHFDVSARRSPTKDGALVKTIGDAVMAVFRRPVSSLRAMLAAQARAGRSSDGGRPLLLKAGIHAGPCIAVTLNERLDYFGSTVNAAARIVDLSSGEDVVVSGCRLADPEVAELLAGVRAVARAARRDPQGLRRRALRALAGEAAWLVAVATRQRPAAQTLAERVVLGTLIRSTSGRDRAARAWRSRVAAIERRPRTVARRMRFPI